MENSSLDGPAPAPRTDRERKMATHDEHVGGGGDREGEDEDQRRSIISPRWLKTTVETNREAFEMEMERHRRRYDREFRRFWRASRTPT